MLVVNLFPWTSPTMEITSPRSEKHGLDVSQFGGKAGWSDLRSVMLTNRQPPQKFMETLSGPP